MSSVRKIIPTCPEHCVGIELEFDLRDPRMFTPLKEQLLFDRHSMRLDREVITYGNFPGGMHGYELTMLCAENDFEWRLKQALDVLSNPLYTAFVDIRCGLHVHLDARFRDGHRMYEVLLQELDFLLSCASIERRSRPYLYDDRPLWRYRSYKTVEVRVLESSFDYDKIHAFIHRLVSLAQLVT